MVVKQQKNKKTSIKGSGAPHNRNVNLSAANRIHRHTQVWQLAKSNSKKKRLNKVGDLIKMV